MNWYQETLRATVVLLVASVALIAPGLAGLGGSGALAAALVALAAVLFVGRQWLETRLEAIVFRLGYYGRALWVGPLVGGGVVLVGLDATAAELQALGGLVGLLGMANYFLRPLYRLVYGTVERVAGVSG